MIITHNTLKNRVRKHGAEYYRYVGRCEDPRFASGYGCSLAIIIDCFFQQTLHVDATDEQVEKICGKCEF